MKFLSTVLAVGLLLLGTACQNTPPRIYGEIETSPDMFAVNPADIAVLPIEDATPRGVARDACGPIRHQIAEALVGRLYSPLSTSRIDEILGDQESARNATVVDASWLASIGGHFGEDATLAVRLTDWDASSLMSTGWVHFEADVSLVSPQRPQRLWGGSFSGSIKAGGEGPGPLGRQNREASVAHEFARHLVSFLPRRRP